jgi:hypothetical protein
MAARTSQATADAMLLLPSTPPPPPVSSDVSPSMGYHHHHHHFNTSTANMHNPPENLSPGREQEWKRQRVSNHHLHSHQAQDQHSSNKDDTIWSPSLFSNSDAILQDLKATAAAAAPLNATSFAKNESNTTTTTTTTSSMGSIQNGNHLQHGGYLTNAMATKLTLRDHAEDQDATNAVRYHASHPNMSSEPSVPKVTPTLDLSADSAMDGLAALSTAAFLRLDESY